MTYDLRLVAYEPNGSRLGLLPDPLNITAAFPHNDASSLTVSYSRLAMSGSILQRGLYEGLEIGLEISTETIDWFEPANARFILIKRNVDTMDETDTVSLTLPGYSWLLRKARNLETTLILPESHSQGGKRPFYAADAGSIIGTLLQENSLRNGVPISIDFSDALDSAGSPWDKTLTIYYELGIDIWTILENLKDQGVVDWCMQGRTLQLYNTDTTLAPDYSTGDSPVTLHLAIDVTEAPEEESLEEVIGRVLIRGDNGLTISQDNPTAPTPWGVWESFISQGGVSDQATALSLIQADLERGSRIRGQYTRGLQFETSRYKPFIHYTPGSYISAPIAGGVRDRVRVAQVTLTRDDGVVSGNVILNDRIIDAELRRSRRITGIVGGSTVGGGSGAIPSDPTNTTDTRTPAAPIGFVVSSTSYIDLSSVAQGRVSAQWAAVTTANDGSAMSVAGYEFWGRKNETGVPWAQLAVTVADATTTAYAPITPGETWLFRVRARGVFSPSPGDWSETLTLVIAEDTDPPPQPSTPLVATRLGVITVTWDGLNSSGGGMPVDFKRVDVAMGSSPDAVTVVDSLTGPGSVTIAGQPYNTERFFRLRAYDHSDNASPWSVEVSAMPAPLVDTDVIGQVINGAHIQDGTLVASDKVVANSITGAEIAALAIEAGHIAANAIEADKIDAGAVQAQHISFGAVSPGVLTYGIDELAPNPVWSIPEQRTLYPTSVDWAYDSNSAFLVNGQTHTLRSDFGSLAQFIFMPKMNCTTGDKFYVRFDALRPTLDVDWAPKITLNVRDANNTLIGADELVATGGTYLRTNLATNPSLGSTSTTGWSADAGTSGIVDAMRIASTGYAGVGFFRVTWLTGTADVSGGVVAGASLATVAGGLKTTASFYVRVSKTQRLQPQLRWWSAPGGEVVSIVYGDELIVTANEWTRVSVSATAPAAATALSFAAYAVGGTSATAWAADDTLDVDAYLVEQENTTVGNDGGLAGYFDGSTSGAAWTGTPDASTSTMLTIEDAYVTYEKVIEIPPNGLTIEPAFDRTAAGTSQTWYISKVSVRRAMVSTSSSGQRWEASPQGIRMWGPNDDGDPSVDITTSGANAITLRSPTTDEPVVVMDNGGNLSAETVTANNAFNYRGIELMEWFYQLPRGVVAASGSFPNSIANVNTEYGLCEVSWVTPDGPSRMYRMNIMNLYFQHWGNQIGIRVRVTTNGAQPTITSSLFAEYQTPQFSGGNNTAWSPTFAGGNQLGDLPPNTLVRALLTIRSITGNNFAWVNANNPRWFIEDVGPQQALGGIISSGGGTSPDSGYVPPPSSSPVRIYTSAETTRKWDQSYRGNDAQYTYDSSKNYQGQYLTSNGVLKSAIGAPDKMFTDLAGAAVEWIRVYLYAQHWRSSSGGTAVLGVHASSNKPSTFPGITGAFSVKFGRNQGIWVTLPSPWYAYFKSGAYRGITLHANNSTASEYYGYFAAAATKWQWKYWK